MLAKFLKIVKIYQSDIVLAIAVVLISVAAFNLGKASTLNKQKAQIIIKEPLTASGLENKTAVENKKLKVGSERSAVTSVVASKNSTGKVYHFPWCSSASKIADKNKITFATEALAIAAGYTLAGNCQK